MLRVGRRNPSPTAKLLYIWWLKQFSAATLLPCSSLGHNQEKPCWLTNASRCTVNKRKQKTHRTYYPNSRATGSPREVKKWLWAAECSSRTLLGSLRASLPSCESLKNCWWGEEGQHCSGSLIASVKGCERKAEGSASHLTSWGEHRFEILIWGLIALPGKWIGPFESDENPSCTASFLDFLEKCLNNCCLTIRS